MWPMGMGLAPGNFLFLGDYVDRGQSSLECIAYLFAQKLLHPKKLFLIRGNHETRAINGLEAHYGSGCFLAQCKARFGNEEGYIVWHQINHAFDRLPLAAVIDNDIFCVHGGVPRPVRSERTLESIQKIPHTALLDVLDAKYYEENAQMSMVSDMLWGDPASEEKEPSMDSKGFGKSLRGGVAVSFGEKAIENFLQQHKFSRILRAHEAKMDGIAVSKSARVITIFSTSKDHGLGEDAKCGCLLIDHGKISAINRSPQVTKNPQLQRRRSMSFQTEAHNGGAPMGPPLRTGQESNSSGIAGSASTGIGRPWSNFQGSTLSDVLSNAQDDDDGSAARTARATSMEANANDGGSDSTDDEDDQSAPQPPRQPRTRVIARPSNTAERARSAIASSVAVLALPSGTPRSASEHVEDEEDNNQNDDF